MHTVVVNECLHAMISMEREEKELGEAKYSRGAANHSHIQGEAWQREHH